MEKETIEFLCVLAGTIAGYGALRQSVKDLACRVKDIEDDYVPRPEIERAITNIERNTASTHNLVSALVYSRGNRHDARNVLQDQADAVFMAKPQV